MMKILVVLIFLSFSSCLSNRVYDRDTSSAHHDNASSGEHHSSTYDHESFLGKEESKIFDSLPANESQKRLLELVQKKIDLNNDKQLDKDEVKKWIRYISQKVLQDERDRFWKDLDMPLVPGALLSWDHYSVKSYGREEDYKHDQSYAEEVKKRSRRDKAKWRQADRNYDDKLDLNEFLSFYRPEESHHMHSIIVDQTIEDIDKNKDGYIDMDEYISDLVKNRDAGSYSDTGFIKEQKRSFETYYDLNKDGKLDRDEVQNWILPKDYDHVEAETLHLFEHADDNKDQHLSMKEISKHFDLFAGSQATSYGKIINKNHDDL